MIEEILLLNLAKQNLLRWLISLSKFDLFRNNANSFQIIAWTGIYTYIYKMLLELCVSQHFHNVC